MTNLNDALLDDLLGKLESARAWSPRVVAKLEALIHSENDYNLFRCIGFRRKREPSRLNGLPRCADPVHPIRNYLKTLGEYIILVPTKDSR